jgi:hypothetical protein
MYERSLDIRSSDVDTAKVVEDYLSHRSMAEIPFKKRRQR